MVKSLEELYKKLGLNQSNGLHYFDENKLYDFLALRYKKSLDKIKPESFFCIDNEPFILFFYEDSNNKNRLKEIHKQVWNFDKAPIAVVVTEKDVIFYNAFNFDKKESELVKLIDKNKALKELTFENLLSGRFLENYGKQFNEKKRLNIDLLNHIKACRDELKENDLEEKYANILTLRMVFLRYLKDRNILSKVYNFDDILQNKNSFFSLLKDLKEKFNGDLFIIEAYEKNKLNEKHLSTLLKFFKGADIIAGQLKLIDFYDFSIIPVELISNIYEYFLQDQQKEKKAYYTPTFLVDYIISQTIDNHNSSNCKILDPACGSGIFLVEALRKIIVKAEKEKGSKLNNQELLSIVEKNIFGIDKDEEAIKIAIFSICITLMDYVDTDNFDSFKFKPLKKKNLFRADFFDENNDFNELLKKNKPDFILSNPPYSTKDKGVHLKYAKKENIPVSYKQIAQTFMARTKDFSKENTISAMVLTSKILYNNKANQFRQYFLKNFFIKQVFELSSVRHLVFINADPPVSMIFFQYSFDKETSENTVIHISLKPNIFFKQFKSLFIEKYDSKKVKQSYFKVYDWLWKVLLYGNILDFYFIKRLDLEFDKIVDLKNKMILDIQVGFTVGTSKKYNVKHLNKYLFLDPKALTRYNIDSSNLKYFNKQFVHRQSSEIAFKSPMLLFKKGVTKDFSCSAAVNIKNDLVFAETIYSLRDTQNNNKNLYNICGLFNSNLFNYLVFMKGSSTGVEREQVFLDEYLNIIPYAFSNKIYDLSEKFHQSTIINDSLVNQEICNTYRLTNIEKELIDYSMKVSIPIWNYGNNNDIPEALKNVSEDQLKDYASIFIDYFQKYYDNFNVEIYKNDYIVGVVFKARDQNKPEETISFKKADSITKFFELLSLLSIENLSSNIFIHKDIRGFQENSFYIIKLNQYKNWHRAIARLDLAEFVSAIFDAEQKECTIIK